MTVLVIIFGLVALFASDNGIVNFEKVGLPVLMIISVYHIIMLIVVQVYIFSKETSLLRGMVLIISLNNVCRVAKTLQKSFIPMSGILSLCGCCSDC